MHSINQTYDYNITVKLVPIEPTEAKLQANDKIKLIIMNKSDLSS